MDATTVQFITMVSEDDGQFNEAARAHAFHLSLVTVLIGARAQLMSVNLLKSLSIIRHRMKTKRNNKKAPNHLLHDANDDYTLNMVLNMSYFISLLLV